MSKKELADQTRKALEEFKRLPPQEQIKRLIASGTIDEHGRVLMGPAETLEGPDGQAMHANSGARASPGGSPRPER